MARKSNVASDGPSTGDASEHSDVEMQDQQDDKMNGFKKFGVSAITRAPSISLQRGQDWLYLWQIQERYADIAGTVQFRHTRLYGTNETPLRCTAPTHRLTFEQDSDTNPNTTASSVAGDHNTQDGRKRRAEVMNMRKSIYGRKHDRLGASKVRLNVHYIL